MAINRLIQGSLQNGLPKFDTVWDGVSAVGSMEAISTITIGSTTESAAAFNNIPQTYQHLQLRCMFYEPSDTLTMIFNNQLANNYTSHYVSGDGNSATSAYYASPNKFYIGTSYGSGAGTLRFGVCIVDILNYTNTNMYKTIRSFTGCDNNTVNGKIFLYSGEWYSTQAVSRIDINGSAYGALAQYSSFSLYGIK